MNKIKQLAEAARAECDSMVRLESGEIIAMKDMTFDQLLTENWEVCKPLLSAFRPYNVKEIPFLVGLKVQGVRTGDVHLITGTSLQHKQVRIGGAFRLTTDLILSGYTFLDGMPCGVANTLRACAGTGETAYPARVGITSRGPVFELSVGGIWLGRTYSEYSVFAEGEQCE